MTRDTNLSQFTEKQTKELLRNFVSQGQSRTKKKPTKLPNKRAVKSVQHLSCTQQFISLKEKMLTDLTGGSFLTHKTNVIKSLPRRNYAIKPIKIHRFSNKTARRFTLSNKIL